MPLGAAVAAIRARAESLWPGVEAAVPLAWPNETFERPLSDRGTPEPFVTVEVKWNGGEFVSIGAPGSNRVRREGQVWAFAFIPVGMGEGRAHQLAGEMGSIFEGQDFSGIVCWGMEPGGPVPTGQPRR
jgi:hypothetical protein